MALVMGSPVRVAGTGLAIDVSGTIKVWPYTTDPAYTGGFPFAFSTLGEVNCHVLGGQVGLRQTYQSGVAESGESRWQWYAQVAGGADGGPLGAAGPEQIYRYLDAGPGSEPEVQLGDLPLTAAWQFSYSGLVIKRRHGVNVQPKRAHLHPRDTVAVDDWYLTPDFQVTASIGGVSFTSPARRAWPEFEGLTEAEIGDAPAGDLGVGIAAWMDCWRSWSWGYPIVEVTVSGVDFSGYRFRFAGGDSGSTPDGHLWLGEGSRLVAQALTKPLSSVSGASGHATAFLPIQYTWDLDCRLFDGGDAALDPDVAAGYLERVAASPGCQMRPRLYRLSELPDGGASIPPVQGGPIDETDYCAIPFDPHGNIPAFGLAIDETWALKHWLCPGGPVEYIEDAAIEDQSDRYFTLEVPGVNAGCAGGAQEIGGVGAPGRDILPLAPARPGEPVKRWSCGGEVAEAVESTLAAPRFVIAAGGRGAISYQPITRLWDRLALLPQTDASEPPIPKDWTWPWQSKAQASGAGLASDPPDPREPDWAEDVWHWGGLSYLKLRLRRRRPGGAWGEDVGPLTIALRLSWSTIEIEDPHYTCGSWRAEEWEMTRASAEATWTATVAADDETIIIDLLCPDDGTMPRLYCVDTVEIGGLEADDEPVELELTELRLIRDAGWDHTGRKAAAAPRMVGSNKETWDFFTDWEGQVLAVDGNTRVLELPGEPWRNRGPERGRGYIEALQHCPTYSGPASWLHYARPIGDLAAGHLIEGLAAAVDARPMTDAAGPGGAVERLADGLMYWGANHLWQTPKPGEADLALPASIQVVSWQIAKFWPGYVIRARKQLGGAAWGLLKTRDGRRRITGDLATGWWWRIWQQVTAYRDAEEKAIEPPDGAPEVGHYTLLSEGALAERVDPHGLFRTPGLPPSKTRIWNAARGEDPAAHTDTAEVVYRLQVWDTSEQPTPWLAYDMNEPAEVAAMMADPALGDEATFSIATRRLTPISLRLGRGGDIQAVYTPWDTVMISHRAGLRWPADPGQRWAPDARSVSVPLPQAGLVVEGVSAWVHQGAWPWETTRVHEVGTRAAVTAQLDGQLLVVGEVAGELVLCRTTQSGRPARGESIVATLPGHTHPSLVLNMHRGTSLCLARRTEDGVCCAYEVCRTAPGREQEFVYRGTIAPCDPVCQGVVHTPEGHYLVALCYRGDIILYRSRNHGEDWEALG